MSLQRAAPAVFGAPPVSAKKCLKKSSCKLGKQEFYGFGKNNQGMSISFELYGFPIC